MSKNRHNRQPQQPGESLAAAVAAMAQPAVSTADVPHDHNDRPPSAEDFAALVAQQQAEDAAAEAAEQTAAVAVVDEPNPDLTPPANLTCTDPLWECTCDDICIPRRTIQAPSADVAEERYRAALLIRRPKVSVKRL